MRRVLICVLAAVVGMLSPVGRAQETESSALINQALDRQVKLNIANTNLLDAMKQVGNITGVPIKADPAVWDLLPWGRDTEVRATIENRTLRQALEAVTLKLGLTFVLRGQSLELQPLPSLRRLGERATVTELQSLEVLAKPLDLKSGEKVKLQELVEAIDLKLGSIDGGAFRVENRSSTSPRVPQDAMVAVARGATMLEALEAIHVQTAATWFPKGRDVVIVSKQDQTARLLGKSISLAYRGTDVGEVLNELSIKSGVKFTYEPGSVQSIPTQFSKIRLIAERTTVEEALGVISSVTGLGYVVREDEVYIWNASVAPGGQPRDRMVGWFLTDSGLNVTILESQCPPDVREFVESERKKQIEAMRKLMMEKGFKPSAGSTSIGGGALPPVRPAPEKPQPPTPAPGQTPKPGDAPAGGGVQSGGAKDL